MAVTINADTTNGLVMTPDTSGEINLQAGGATIATVDSSGITMASGKGLAATGHVLQVVQVFKNDVFSTTSTSYVDVTGLSASITPSSASNKILVLLRTTQAASGPDQVFTTLLRDATTIAAANTKDYFSHMYPSRNSTDTNIYIPHGSTHVDYLDSPSTTSSVTYKVQMKVNTATGYINRSRDSDNYRGVSSITLMEVAG
jgi:hypothetical protein